MDRGFLLEPCHGANGPCSPPLLLLPFPIAGQPQTGIGSFGFREEIQQLLSPPISGPFLLLLIPGKAFRRRWQYIL